VRLRQHQMTGKGPLRQNTSTVSAADNCLRCIQLRSRALLLSISRVLLRDRSVRHTMLREHIDALRQTLAELLRRNYFGKCTGLAKKFVEALGLAESESHSSTQC